MTIPVLMYHAVAARPADAAYGLSVHPDRFAAQLELLAAEGFTTITVGELAAIRRRCAALPVIDDRSAEEIVGYDDSGLPS